MALIDPQTLTEEQKKHLHIYYWEAENDLKNDKKLIQLIGYGRITLLESVFGEEFFKKETN